MNDITKAQQPAAFTSLPKQKMKKARIHPFGGCTYQLFSLSVPLSFILF